MMCGSICWGILCFASVAVGQWVKEMESMFQNWLKKGINYYVTIDCLQLFNLSFTCSKPTDFMPIYIQYKLFKTRKCQKQSPGGVL